MLRKSIILVVVLSFCSSLLFAKTATAPTVGDGSSESPYEIGTFNNLYWIAVDAGRWSLYYIQTADIDASETSSWDDGDGEDPEGWSPIGDVTTKFTGLYDGAGYKIDGIYIDRSSVDFVGLFGQTNFATIEDLGVTNVDIVGRRYTGGLIGYGPGSTIYNCYSSGNVNGSNYAGGLIGRGPLVVSSCYSNCNVEGVSGCHGVGGLMGYGATNVSNCYSTGSVSGIGNGTSSEFGGLIGNAWSTVSNCYSTGSVSGTNANLSGCVGGSGTNVTNTFWDIETSGLSSSEGGTGKTTEEMKDIATFTDTDTEGLTIAWDFPGTLNDDAETNDYWDMDIPNGLLNGGYPFLNWENGTEIALPIELVFFTANYSRAAVTLNWETASETNNTHFLIYRNDIIIGTIDGAGTSSEPHEYEFMDKQVISGDTYIYTLADVSYANVETKYTDNAITISVPENDIPVEFVLKGNYPNPFNPRTAISYELSAISNVELSIFDMNGKKVVTLVNGSKPAGYHSVNWDASNVSSGIYFYSLQAGDFIETKKMVFMK